VPDSTETKAAIFDLGGVVIDVRVENIFRYWGRCIGLTAQDVAGKFETDSHAPFERGEISPEEFHQYVVKKLGAAIAFEDFYRGWNSIFCGVIPGIESLLAKLSGRLRLAMLTNTNDPHARRWRELYGEVLASFEKIFVSCEMGMRKPEPRCFHAVLDAMGLEPAHAVFIDDNRDNVEAGVAAGMKGIVAESPQQIAGRLAEMGVPAE
jgi:putative hydrolase of the HAD superfamily